ncbi:hypothetical protein ACQ4PT_010991 [Festuca glaucescens]
MAQVFGPKSLIAPSHHALFLLCTLIFLSSNTIIFSSAQATNRTEDDRQALLCFKSGISKDPASVLGSWRNDSLNFCSWQGVTCSMTPAIRVVSIQFRFKRLTGALSSCIAGLTSLVQMDLQNNKFSGSIPDETGELRSLQTLMLAGNRLAGNIPLSLGAVTSLRSVNLANNSLSGVIPDSLSNSSLLSEIILSRNNLSGAIPANLFKSSKLVSVDPQWNALSGAIPHFQKMDSLQSLSLTGNLLSGTIPVSLGNVSSLRSLLLAQNNLKGSIPETLGQISHLKLLDLSYNMFSGYVPATLYNVSSLTTLGQIPHLKLLDLSYNMFSGYVPATLYNVSSLTFFGLGSNTFIGQIPSDIGHSLPNLQILVMGFNNFSGLIPDSLTNMSKLEVLDLSSNSLTGLVPSLGSLPNLNKLLLAINILEAGNWAFLTSLTKCTQLSRLSLAGNMLNGSLPKSVGNLSRKLEWLNFSGNQISGSIPAEIGNLVNLTLLDMGQNMLSGQIPLTVQNLSNLFVLKLSNNRLSGQIPSAIGVIPHEIGNLINLGLLSVSNNILSGELPSALGLCVAMVSLHMEGNMLSGIIPQSFSSLKGNKTQPSESFKETIKRVSYGDILKATNWFSLVNRISSSHTASVYIGRFEFKTDLVAIKAFHLTEQGSRNSFFTECEVLKHTRHRNLVQAITLCSTVDFDNNEFKAIVYEFMANGSLDMWIHPRIHQGTPRRLLSLGQWISIAADVASALDYLHNQLIPPMIHCDLKPSNVLLDYDMTSRIGDFGSAKFLSSCRGTPEGLAGFAGTIGYIAPEYGMGCKISTGGDVYSFGVLLLEMLTAVRPTHVQCGNAFSLHKYVGLAFPEGIAEVLDPHMPSEEDEAAASLRMQNYIMPLVSIGLMCSMESPKDRPGIHDVCAKIVAIKEAFVETL